ncbi:MAG TPA: hypothetical protein VG013_34005 [Gemmataceae bacterium]|jgi:hypothetical protein|nr:hypothetical protein [Gemmataceae bacterium]
MAQEDSVEVTKGDLRAAWAVLENLAVSFDQIGGAFGAGGDAANGAARQRALQEALAAYLTPDLVKAINEARIRLGRYLSDTEAEALARQIAYWDYAAMSKAAREKG